MQSYERYSKEYRATNRFFKIVSILVFLGVAAYFLFVITIGMKLFDACGDSPGKCIGQFIKEVQEGMK